MGGSSSKSATSSSTSNLSQDNRAVASDNATILGQNASLMISNEFGDNVLNAFKETLGLVRDAGRAVVDTTEQVSKSSQNTVDAITTALERQQKGTTTTFTDMIPLILVAVVGIFVFSLIFKKK